MKHGKRSITLRWKSRVVYIIVSYTMRSTICTYQSDLYFFLFSDAFHDRAHPFARSWNAFWNNGGGVLLATLICHKMVQYNHFVYRSFVITVASQSTIFSHFDVLFIHQSEVWCLSIPTYSNVNGR